MEWISFITIAEVWHSMNTCQFVLSVFVPFFIHLTRIYWVSDICQGIQKDTESTKMNQSQFLFSRLSASGGCGGSSRVNRQLEKNMTGTELNEVGAQCYCGIPEVGVVSSRTRVVYTEDMTSKLDIEDPGSSDSGNYSWAMMYAKNMPSPEGKLWTVPGCRSNLWLVGFMGPRATMNIQYKTADLFKTLWNICMCVLCRQVLFVCVDQRTSVVIHQVLPPFCFETGSFDGLELTK